MRIRAGAVVISLIATMLVAGPVSAGRSTNLLTNGAVDRTLRGWTLSDPQAWCGGTQYIKVAKSRTTSTPVIDGGAAYLNACGSDTPDPSISQTVSVQANTTYVVSGIYWVEPNNGNGSDADFALEVDGVTAILVLTDATNGWKSFTTTVFTGPGQTSLAVKFIGEVASDHAVFVDNLTVELAP